MSVGLNFPEYSFRTRAIEEKKEIFDEVRKSWVSLTPEELVRQHVLRWMTEVKKYPASLLAVEKTIEVNGLKKRCDIIAYSKSGKPIVIVECKAPDVKITQEVFDQAARYNLVLDARLFLLTNGISHYCCQLDHSVKAYRFLRELPAYIST
ncbi:MAG TPA: type I restriction enzyme HsdR N-terminal domain-containing protein [Bacteroidia bacterium]|jgi:hypothetical protein|nr:type I restriction enzyme HsdR N-terminal domain-containing protein [Bacteroidia bacterium]